MITEEDRIYFKKARLVSIILLASPLIYAGILVMLYTNKLEFGEFGSDTLNIITIVLSVLGLFSLLQGIMIPRRLIRMAKNRTQITTGQTIFGAYIIRYAIFEAISIYGLILGILGGEIPIIIAFFIVSLIAMIFTFPTEDRWASHLTESNQADKKKN